MIEYIFFDAALRDKFVAYAEQRGVPCTASDDSMGLVVAIPEDIPEDVSDEIEDYYESLEDEQEDLSKAEGDLNRLAGFNFTLPDGQSRMLPLQPDMANRLLANFSTGRDPGFAQCRGGMHAEPERRASVPHTRRPKRISKAICRSDPRAASSYPG